MQFNQAYATTFDRAAGLLLLAEAGNFDNVGEYIEFAFEAAVAFCPGILNTPAKREHRYQRRTIVAAVSALWLQNAAIAA